MATSESSCSSKATSTKRVRAEAAAQSGVTMSATLALSNGDKGVSGEAVGNPTTTGSSGNSWAWSPVRDGRTFRATVEFEDGYNTVTKSDTDKTETLADPVVSFGTRTTRSIVVYVDASNGSSVRVKKSSDADSTYKASGTKFDSLADGASIAFTGRNTDGFNETTSKASRWTISMPTPSCSSTLNDSSAPGAITVSSSSTSTAGVSRYVSISKSGSWSSSGTKFSSLGAGTYTPYAWFSDGVNTTSDACGSRTIVNPAPSTPTSVRVGAFTPTKAYLRFNVPGAGSLTSFSFQFQQFDAVQGWKTTISKTLTPGMSGEYAVVIRGNEVELQFPYSAESGSGWATVRARAQVANAAGSSGWSGWALGG